MGVFNRRFQDWKGTTRSGLVTVSGSVLIGSSGAVTSYDLPGCTVTLVSSKTGRYRIQLIEDDLVTASAPSQPTDTAGTTAVVPWGIQGISACYVSPVADNALTKDAGMAWAVRNFTPLSGYFDLQWYTSTDSSGETHTDAHPESGAILLISFNVKVSNVVP